MPTSPPRGSCLLRRAGVGVLLLLTACTSWRVQPVAPVQLVGEEVPAKVRLHGHNGRLLVMRHPFVRNDSVLGVVSRDTTGLPAVGIRTIEVRRFNWLKTTGLVVGVGGLVAGAACLVACSWGTFSLGGL